MWRKKVDPAVLPLTSPLLLAAAEKNLEEITLCLAQGESPNLQGGKIKNSALHVLLLDGCFCSDCTETTEACINVLIQHGADTNLKNGKGKVPLDFAVENMAPASIVKLLMKHGATVLSTKGIKSGPLALKLVRRMPETYLESLNEAITFQSSTLKGEETRVVELDWRPIIYAASGPKCYRNWQETRFLNDALKQGTEDTRSLILSHPLIRAFVELKRPLYWKYFGSLYCIWTVSTFIAYMMYIWWLYSFKCEYKAPRNDSVTDFIADYEMENDSSYNETSEEFCPSGPCELTVEMSISAAVILFFYVTGPMALEWRKIVGNGFGAWAKQWQSYVLVPATSFVIMTLHPALSFGSTFICLEWQYPTAALGMLVGALSILVQLAPVPFISLYLEMLFRVFLRIMLAALAFFPLFIGFFCSFKLLFTNADLNAFELFEMLVSDNDYEQLLDRDRGAFYMFVSYTFFVLFIVLLVIVILNFLIGLAVSDIQVLREKARVSNLMNLIGGFYLMDSAWGGNRSYNSVIRAGKSLQFQFQPLKESEKRLSTKLKLELLSIARGRHQDILRENDDPVAIQGVEETKEEKPDGEDVDSGPAFPSEEPKGGGFY